MPRSYVHRNSKSGALISYRLHYALRICRTQYSRILSEIDIKLIPRWGPRDNTGCGEKNDQRKRRADAVHVRPNEAVQ
jgi:hypothetical protein